MLIAVVCAFVLAVAFRSREPDLVTYTSPPITIHQKTFRLQVLIPPAWKAEPPNVGAPITLLGGQKRPAATVAWINIVPHEAPAGWIQQWFRPRYKGGTEDARMLLYATVPSLHPNRKGTTRSWSDGIYWHASRTIDGVDEFQVTYTRQFRPDFDATSRKICESFRVIE